MTKTVFNVLVFSLALLPLTVLAQNNDAAPAGSPGCGDFATQFHVKTVKGPHKPAQPEVGKALVYFIEDDSNLNSATKPTTRAGLDGKWVGATHGNSFLYFSVEPGLHHLCASWQVKKSHPVAGVLLGVSIGRDPRDAATRFTAEAGGIYYFVAKNSSVRTESSTTEDFTLTRLDSDEGQLRVNGSKLATSQQKK